METRVIVNGEEIGDDVDIADALAALPPAKRYIAVKDGKAVGELMWDGVSKFDHPDGAEIVAVEDYKGDPYVPEERPEERAQRRLSERAVVLLDKLKEDRRGFGDLTAAQRAAVQRRMLNMTIVLGKMVLAMADEDAEDSEE